MTLTAITPHIHWRTGQGFYSLESSSAALVSLSPSRAVSERPGRAYQATQESASSQLHERRMCRFRPETDVDPHQPCPGQRSSIGGSPSSYYHSLSSMNWVDQPAGPCGHSRNRSSDTTTASAAAGVRSIASARTRSKKSSGRSGTSATVRSSHLWYGYSTRLWASTRRQANSASRPAAHPSRYGSSRLAASPTYHWAAWAWARKRAMRTSTPASG